MKPKDEVLSIGTEGPAYGFMIVPCSVVDLGLSPTALALYLVTKAICQRGESGGNRFSFASAAKVLGTSVLKMLAAREELVAIGLFKLEEWEDDDEIRERVIVDETILP